MKSTDVEIAKEVVGLVGSVANENEQFRKDYCARLEGLPAEIRIHGLVRALLQASLDADKDGAKRALHHVVRELDGARYLDRLPEPQELAAYLTQLSPTELRRKTASAIQRSSWLKTLSKPLKPAKKQRQPLDNEPVAEPTQPEPQL